MIFKAGRSSFATAAMVTMLVGSATSSLPQAVVAKMMRARASGCSSPVYRRFDFWVGDWNVSRSKAGFAAAA